MSKLSAFVTLSKSRSGRYYVARVKISSFAILAKPDALDKTLILMAHLHDQSMPVTVSRELRMMMGRLSQSSSTFVDSGPQHTSALSCVGLGVIPSRGKSGRYFLSRREAQGHFSNEGET